MRFNARSHGLRRHARSVWTPLPMWREPSGEEFVIGHLAYSTADPLVASVGHPGLPGGVMSLPWRTLEVAARQTVSHAGTVIQPSGEWLLVRFPDERLWRMRRQAHQMFTACVAGLLPGEKRQEVGDWDDALDDLLSGEYDGGCADGTGHGR
ncbi:hypothetical protein [Spongiactinospora sp. TRM90649]|uniref:hypothetical protein n=1 Tax=Spongiactinospora sp. TRM90649 TaxID=3031114 RepID=UPI0023F9EB34|nr:hypothetical protein [Spongiactinospora sp. TRM90649]MDF5756683.1 hypothetical protein [Spongiactinospora sp. TRM90649]